MTSIEELVDCSAPLKREVLDFVKAPRFDRAFRREVDRRLGDPTAASQPGPPDPGR
jgi:hypothetical protein